MNFEQLVGSIRQIHQELFSKAAKAINLGLTPIISPPIREILSPESFLYGKSHLQHLSFPQVKYFVEKTAQLQEQFACSSELEGEIKRNLAGLGDEC